MIKCKDLTEEASNYLDGDLPLPKRIGLFFHLLICRSCSNYLQQMRNTIKTVKVFRPKEKETYDTCPLVKKLRDLARKPD